MRRLLTALAPDYTPPVLDDDTGDAVDTGERPAGGCACTHTSSPLLVASVCLDACIGLEAVSCVTSVTVFVHRVA